jgi:hypothetical protein
MNKTQLPDEFKNGFTRNIDGYLAHFKPIDGELSLSLTELGEMAGYENPKIGAYNAYQRNKDEFINNIDILLESSEIPKSLGKSGRPAQEPRFTIKGIFLFFCFVRTEKGRRVRARMAEIMEELAVKGYVIQPGAEHAFLTDLKTDIISAINTRFTPIEERLTALESNQGAIATLTTKVADLSGTREGYDAARKYQLENFYTPTQWAEEYHGDELPSRFNAGGRFDNFCALQWNLDTGKWPAKRHPLINGNKRPEFYWPRTYEVRQAFERYFKDFISRVMRQQKLELVPRKEDVKDKD